MHLFISMIMTRNINFTFVNAFNDKEQEDEIIQEELLSQNAK
jgi:hypothetical protein